MVVPNDVQQIAARIRSVTAAKVVAVDPAKQNEPIYDLEAETQRFGPAHPVDNPCMRHVGSEFADPVDGGGDGASGGDGGLCAARGGAAALLALGSLLSLAVRVR